MGKPFVDRDISIKNAEIFARKLAQELKATFIELDSENKIYRLVLEDKINYLDISEIQGENILEDLARRDFTMNAIAINLANGEIIDPFNGMLDIENKIIKHIKDTNFTDDPLRILRAFRFASLTGFELSKEVRYCIDKYKHLLFNPARERINYELMKLFGGENCSKVLLKMDEFGILEEIFPQVKDMKKVPPNTHHHLDLFNHVVETVRNIEELYLTANYSIKTHLNLVDFGGFPRINHLKLAGFLHDIGKFSTWTIEEETGHIGKYDIEALQQELSRLNYSWQKGRIKTVEEYDRRYDELMEQIEAANEEIQSSNDGPDFEKIRSILCEGWKDMYMALDAEHKRAFWRSFVEVIELEWTRDVKRVTNIKFF